MKPCPDETTDWPCDANVDVVPMRAFVGDDRAGHRVVADEVVDRLVGEHHAPAEGHAFGIALDDVNVVRRVAQLHRNGEGQPGRSRADDLDPHAASSTARRNCSTAALNATGCSRLARCPASAIVLSVTGGRSATALPANVGECMGKGRRRDAVLVAHQHERRHVDRGGAVALVGEPYGGSSAAIGRGVDRTHRRNDLRRDCGTRRRAEQHRRACFGEGAHGHGLARRDRAIVDGLPIGVGGETVGKDQRSAAVRGERVDGNRHHATKRQPADVGAVDAERIERRKRGGGEVVAGRIRSRCAFAIARIVDRDGAPTLAEVVQLRMPHALVRSDPVQEQDRCRVARAGFRDADHPGAGF